MPILNLTYTLHRKASSSYIIPPESGCTLSEQPGHTLVRTLFSLGVTCNQALESLGV